MILVIQQLQHLWVPLNPLWENALVGQEGSLKRRQEIQHISRGVVFDHIVVKCFVHPIYSYTMGPE